MKRILFILLILSLFVSGCTESDTSPAVESGDYISVNYTGSLDDGTVFDTSIEEVAKAEDIYNPYRTYEPLSFTAGAGQMIKGFDDAVIGMSVGDEKTVTIPSEEAYGAHSPEYVVSVPMETFNQNNMTPVLGEQVRSSGGVGIITNISGENVTVDFNHELAGKDLTFAIEIVSIEKA